LLRGFASLSATTYNSHRGSARREWRFTTLDAELAAVRDDGLAG
jgi:hypothetical protein